MVSENKYVLFICGGKWQMPWLQYLKNKGHKIILVDPYNTSICVPFSDIHLQLDARNIDEIYKEIIVNNYQIQFVTSDQTDVSTQTVSELSKKLHTKGNLPEITELFSNKGKNREYVKEKFGVHFPEFIKASSAHEILDFYNLIGSPIIIKPADAQSSRGIYKIDASNIGNLEQMVSDCFIQTKEPYIIAEKFIVGREITVEGICANGKHHTLAISSKKHFRTGIASELKYPAKWNNGLEKEIIDFHNHLIEGTGLDFGITHAEYLIDDDKGEFYLVEMACRGGGSLIPSDIVPWVTGVPVYDVFYNLITGQETSINPLSKPRHAILYFFEFPAGKVKLVSGLEDAKRLNGVLKLDLEFEANSILKPADDDRGRQGYTILMAETEEELYSTLQKVKDTVKVELEAVDFKLEYGNI